MKDSWKDFLKIVLVIAILYLVYFIANVKVTNNNVLRNIGLTDSEVRSEENAKTR